MRMNTPQPLIQPQMQMQTNIHQSYGQIPVINQPFISYSPQIHQKQHPQISLYDYGYQHHQQRVLQNQLMTPKMLNNYFEQMNLGYQQPPMRYQSNDSLIHLNNSSSLINSPKKLQAPLFKKKYNSSINISNQLIQNNNSNNTESKKNSNNKRNRSSLFVNKSAENKAESDIRDFKRFCDGLKCEIDLYICSQIGSR